MFWASACLVLSSGYPVWRAVRANQRTTLRQAALWLVAAWLLWLATLFASKWGTPEDARVGTYLSLAVTSCALVAVMGARRPGVQAWNFVTCGLLVILALPLLHGQLSPPHLIFLSAILFVGALNYLPTRFGLCAQLAVCAFATAIIALSSRQWQDHLPTRIVPIITATIGLAMWAAHWCKRGVVGDDFDSTWRDFRDRYGAWWALRVRDQFNQSAKNSNLDVFLHWNGLTCGDGRVARDELPALRRLQALLKRFRIEVDSHASR